MIIGIEKKHMNLLRLSLLQYVEGTEIFFYDLAVPRHMRVVMLRR